MIKVTYYDMGDTYNQDIPLEKRNEEQIFYTKYFKSKLLAKLYTLHCSLWHDYTIVEEVIKSDYKDAI